MIPFTGGGGGASERARRLSCDVREVVTENSRSQYAASCVARILLFVEGLGV